MEVSYLKSILTGTASFNSTALLERFWILIVKEVVSKAWSVTYRVVYSVCITIGDISDPE